MPKFVSILIFGGRGKTSLQITSCASGQSAMAPEPTQVNIKPLQPGHPLSLDQKEFTAYSHKHFRKLLKLSVIFWWLEFQNSSLRKDKPSSPIYLTVLKAIRCYRARKNPQFAAKQSCEKLLLKFLILKVTIYL